MRVAKQYSFAAIFTAISCFAQVEEQARAILEKKCVQCHGTVAASGLDLRTREGILKGGTRGPAAVPGDTTRSLLYQAAARSGPLQMPPDGALSATELGTLGRWITDGLPAWSGSTAGGTPTHWAFRPVRNVQPPEDPTAWAANAIDQFIAARLRAAGLTPVESAGKETFLRRVYFDLIGLPPSPEQIRDFLADNSRDADRRVVEQLLASPHYGERWGRYWMDLVRYADTAGDNADYPIPEARLYRDYIIDSFNSDKPYNQFLQEQIAGDILARQGPPEKYAERVLATGFLALSRRYGTAPKELWHLTIEDSIDTLGRVAMGLTLRCARCHDHKFDPVTTKNYYSLYGYFESTRYPFAGAEEFESKRLPRSGFVPLLPPDKAEPLVRAHQQKVDALTGEVERIRKLVPESSKLETLETQINSKKRRIQELKRIGQPTEVKEAERAALEKERDELLATIAVRNAELATLAATLIPLRNDLRQLQMTSLPPSVPGAYAVWEGEPKDVPIQIRGNPAEQGPTAQRGTPDFIASHHPMTIPDGASGRLQLAEWLTDPAHPLTARVMVNRIWQYHFGEGLVPTPSNFGLRGEAPAHPELLDWLASYFVEHDWSIKAVHRLILSSNTYRLASITNAANHAKDPGNRWYWRFNRRRLDAEAIRDSMLFAGGNLDLGRPGEHPFPLIEKWNYTQHFPFKAVYDSNHRTVYLMTQRLHRHPFLALFDGPDTNMSTDVRTSATVPLQALFLMNNPFVQEQAAGLAKRTASQREAKERIRAMIELAWGRRASDSDVNLASAYIERYGRASDVPEQAWISYSKVLLTANEFLYVD